MDILDKLKALCDSFTVTSSDDAKITLKEAIKEITQLRAVAGQARGTDEGSLAAIRRDMNHG